MLAENIIHLLWILFWAPRQSNPCFTWDLWIVVWIDWLSFRVSSYCESRGWKRIYNKHRDDFKLKWCETKSAANYCNFREGSLITILICIINAKEIERKLIISISFLVACHSHKKQQPWNPHVLFPGEQLVYQIPNNTVLTTKIGLLCSLREYERVSSKVNHGQGLRWSGLLYSCCLCLLCISYPGCVTL